MLHNVALANAFLGGASLSPTDADAVVTLCREVRLTDLLARECARVEIMYAAFLCCTTFPHCIRFKLRSLAWDMMV